MKAFFALLVILSVVAHNAECAKILGVFPVPAPSHLILGTALMKKLAEKGHDVTIITPYQEKNVPKNGTYREIVLTGFKEENERKKKEMKMLEQEDLNPFIFILFMVNMLNQLTELTLNHTNVQKLLNSNEHFDLVIIEQFLNEAHKGFAAHFDAPMILFSTVGANTWINMLVANPAPPSYVPDIMLSYSTHMTFWERFINSLMYFFTYNLYYFYNFPAHETLYNKYFPNAPNFKKVLYNSSLVLLNSHPSINNPVPNVPNMINIGGFHVQPSKKLPANLQKFLDNAKEGVVYFSLGSNLRSIDLPPKKLEVFLKTFSKLKQRVLWKWEEDVLPGQPKNVMLGKWLPQQEILAHPNVKLFITHGGLLSTTETIYHGVPVLAIPIAGDQKLNAKRIVNDGFGLLLPYKEISEETLTNKLEELLNNPKYFQNAKKRSDLFHDRQVKPMDTAIYWVEYVIRHKGAEHLRVAGVDLPWYKYMLLDVILFILGTVLLICYICWTLFKIISNCFSFKSKKVKQN